MDAAGELNMAKGKACRTVIVRANLLTFFYKLLYISINCLREETFNLLYKFLLWNFNVFSVMFNCPMISFVLNPFR